MGVLTIVPLIPERNTWKIVSGPRFIFIRVRKAGGRERNEKNYMKEVRKERYGGRSNQRKNVKRENKSIVERKKRTNKYKTKDERKRE